MRPADGLGTRAGESLRRAVPALLWGAVAAVAVLAVPAVLPVFYLFLGTSAMVTAIALLGLGVVSGRGGMISLCQLAFAAVGAWVVDWLSVHDGPGELPVWLLLGGAAAVPLGLLVGLPALRLRGVILAVVTLGFAAAGDVVLAAVGFTGGLTFQAVQRPAAIAGDADFFVFSGLLFISLSLLVSWLARTRLGASWLVVRYSERAAAAAGASVPGSKLRAFALGAFLGGISGGLLAAQVGQPVIQSFDTTGSLVLFVLAVMVGSQYPGGALFGGTMFVAVPEAFQRAGLSQNWATALFAAGAVQALMMGGSVSDAVRGSVRRLRRRLAPPVAPAAPPAVPPVTAPRTAPAGVPALAVRGLRVRFGSVVALAGVDLSVPQGTVVGLVGPNGAGKSTLVDAATGFVRREAGTVSVLGRPVDRLPPHRRAAAGLRRTFQQERVPTGLSVRAYLRFAAGRRVGDREINAVAGWLGSPAAGRDLDDLDVGSRRLVEVAGALLSHPAVLILDEPAAGLGPAERVALAERLPEVPERFGCAVLLIEHDLDLVLGACQTAVVLNFGSVIGHGPAAEVLRDPAVLAAYLGEDEPEEAQRG